MVFGEDAEGRIGGENRCGIGAARIRENRKGAANRCQRILGRMLADLS